jgi:ParB family chromosome partitioning protein
MTTERTRGLGRGLSALMNDGDVQDKPNAAAGHGQTLPIDEISANPDQPRRVFKGDELQALAKSIEEKGLLQPVLVRPSPSGSGYQIVAGERRWRAAQIAQLHEIPVLIRELTDRETLEIGIVENVQRADLNPVEEARAYRQLVKRFDHTQDEIARAVGKSRSHIANMMRLLALPESVLDHLSEGRLSIGHARAVLTAPSPEILADNIVNQGLSVRQAEKLMKGEHGKKAPEKKSVRVEKDADTRAVEQDLSQRLGLAVSIDHNSKNEKGSVTIRYTKLEQLDDICRRLNAG